VEPIVAYCKGYYPSYSREENVKRVKDPQAVEQSAAEPRFESGTFRVQRTLLRHQPVRR